MTYPTFTEIREFIASRHSPRVIEAGISTGNKITEEYGELMEALRTLNACAGVDLPGHQEEHLTRVGEEAADLILSVIASCAVVGIDVSDYVRSKHALNLECEWYETADGRYKRVK